MNLPERLPAISGPRAAARMADIEPFHVMQIIARAKELEAQGRKIVNMVVGEPDFPIAPLVRDAAMRVLEAGHLHYTPALGTTPLREAISGWYRARYETAVPAARIAVTTGSSGALLLTMGVLLDPGDQVLLADPGYPCNRHFVRAMDGEPVGIPVGAQTAYQLTPELVEQHWTPRTKAVLVCSPSNPTGTMIAPQALREIHAAVRARGGVLISDEIYHGLTYGPAAPTAARVRRRHLRHQQLFQVLRHDRVPSRLAGGARAVPVRRGQAGGQSLHLAARPRPAGRARGLPPRHRAAPGRASRAVPRAARLSRTGPARSWASMFR